MRVLANSQINKALIDRPFLEKFSTSTFFQNTSDLCNSIAVEIANILSSNLRIKGSLSKLPNINVNPYAYGTRDLQSLLTSSIIRREFIEHCKQQILLLEPRIDGCEISNASINHIRQHVRFDVSYIIRNVDDVLTTTVNLLI